MGGIAGLTALVPRVGYWPIAIATQAECIIKVPLCIWRINSGKRINDLTRRHDTP